jgi:hypothetical protein
MASQVNHARMGPEYEGPVLSQISCLLTLFDNQSLLNGCAKVCVNYSNLLLRELCRSCFWIWHLYKIIK